MLLMNINCTKVKILKNTLEIYSIHHQSLNLIHIGYNKLAYFTVPGIANFVIGTKVSGSGSSDIQNSRLIIISKNYNN